jgi:RND family efflux transporter MFP subunit
VLLLSCAAVVGCARSQPSLPPPEPPEVLVSYPVEREVTDYEEFTGRTEAVMSVEVRARVSGYLETVNFTEGREVKQGDQLCLIDPRTYQADLERAKANLAQAQAHLKRLDADLERARSLITSRTIGREEFDKILGDRSEAEAAVGVARAGLELSQLNLNFCKVTAPISGRIGKRLVDPGNLVQADTTALTNIVSLDPIYATFDVDEHTLLRVRRLVGAGKVQTSEQVKVPVDLGLSDEQGFPHHGIVQYADPRVDPLTGTLRVRGIFDNPVVGGVNFRLLAPGLFARVRVRVGLPYQAVLVAESSLGTDQGQKFVYVVDEKNTVLYRRVAVGPLSGGLRVIRPGARSEDTLTTKDRVIVSGLQRVRPGVTVKPKVVPMPTLAEDAAAEPASNGNAPSASPPTTDRGSRQPAGPGAANGTQGGRPGSMAAPSSRSSGEGKTGASPLRKKDNKTRMNAD